MKTGLFIILAVIFLFLAVMIVIVNSKNKAVKDIEEASGESKKNLFSFRKLIDNYSVILKSVREYKKYAILTPVMMIGEAAMECGLPFVMSMLVDSIEGATGVESLLPYIITLVIMAFVSLACGIFGGIFAAKAATGLARNLRGDLYQKVQDFSFENIDQFSSSSLVTRMTVDVQSATQAFQMLIRIVVRAPLMLIFSAIMAFISGGKMAFIFIGLIPIIVTGFLLISSRALPIFHRVFGKYDKLNESVEENIKGMRVVKNYVREEFEQEKFNHASNNLLSDFVKAEKVLVFINPMMNFAIHLSNVLILGLGSYMIFSTAKFENGIIIWGSLSVGQLSSLLTYGIQILMSLMMISTIVVMLTMSIEAMSRISEVIRTTSTIKNCDNPVMAVNSGKIEFKNVNFKYKKEAIKNTLEDINLTIHSGEFIGVLGSTGSGKTTLVNLISRLYDVTDGEVLVDGVNVKDYDLKVLRDNVAVVLQKNVLFSGTIEENLKWGNKDATMDDLKRVCDIAQASEFIEKFPDNYFTHIEQGGTNVSGGQKQRLCIARALLKDPKILILDDSTSAVDTRTDKLIRTSLKNDIPHTTKIVIAQRISSIEDADKIIIMNDGKIDAIGRHEDLIKTNEIYQEVYFTQMKKGDTTDAKDENGQC